MIRLTVIEAAAAFAFFGGALAATAPSCVRAVRLSRTAEATENLDQLARAVAASASDPAHPPLTSTPLTPAVVPRGAPADDAPGSWDHPTWKALRFAIDEPHWYAYRVEVDEAKGSIRVVAHGDLDGDGVLSTYARTIVREPKGWTATTALLVQADLE
ncbi:MAG: hypothetical protein HYV09_09015 [Deltaproteobacteria bacterium]|nr:hypothetical protein [Deltaproteobacteria bacterium]